MQETIWTNPYTYIVITILAGVIVTYLLHKFQLRWYAKTMPENYNKLKSHYGKPVISFEGTVRYIQGGIYDSGKVWHPVTVDVYENFAIVSAFGYASILDEKADNYVLSNTNKTIQLSYKKSPYIIEIWCDGASSAEWDTMKKAISCEGDSIID